MTNSISWIFGQKVGVTIEELKNSDPPFDMKKATKYSMVILVDCMGINNVFS